MGKCDPVWPRLLTPEVSNNDALLPVRRKVGKVTLCKEPQVFVGDYLVLPCVVWLRSAAWCGSAYQLSSLPLWDGFQVDVR